MKKLSELVKIDARFEKSVNLTLDLNSEEKINAFIPTHSLCRMLKTFLKGIQSFKGNRASIIVGPYGKGKSHYLLVLVFILSVMDSPAVESLIERIGAVDKELAALIRNIRKRNAPFLPVIINSSDGALKHAFTKAIIQALHRVGLNDVVPDSYYSEAEKAIVRWKYNYPDTYIAFKNALAGESADSFCKRLKRMDGEALALFRGLYPTLTSGGTFNPLVDDDVIAVYQSINRILKTEYGYGGIIVIFDEFSKFIEGHAVDGFAEDMKLLQDVCELCNASKDEQMHLICVAHKSIKAYGSRLPTENLNSFRGVEGRLKEDFFTVSPQNSYELISDAIHKDISFEKWAGRKRAYKVMRDESYQLKTFSSIFDKGDYDEIVSKGCFPLTPVSATLLLSLSEKIAQNERTIFTYIASHETSSLLQCVESSKTDSYVGVGSIYDYFYDLFKEETDTGIHHEWLKAEYALARAASDSEREVIKAIAIIKMINRPDEIVASERFIRLACGLSFELVEESLKSLESKDLIVYKNRSGAYEFKNNIDVDIESAMADYIQKHLMRMDVGSQILDAADEKYILPRKHNLKFRMTRYFNYRFMAAHQFIAMKTTAYLEWNNAPDGIVIFILPESDLDISAIREHTKDLGEANVIVCFPNKTDGCVDSIRKWIATTRLIEDVSFTDNNEIIKAELRGLSESFRDEINEWIQNTYFPVTTAFCSKGQITVGGFGLNRAVSDICDEVYDSTPIINNESINRNEIISAPVKKARETILNEMLIHPGAVSFASESSAEATIYRALFNNVENVDGLKKVHKELDSFIQSSVGQKAPFAHVIEKLTRAPFGMRKGVIPFYLLDAILRTDGMPVIYKENKEVALNAEALSNIVREPKTYSLYVEESSAQKTKYLQNLNELFSDFAEYCREVDTRNRLAMISCIMQSWYRALPQVSMTFDSPDYDGQDVDQITAFRKLFSDLYLSPREIIFERIPKIYGTKSYTVAFTSVKKTRQDIDAHIHIVKGQASSIIRNAFLIPQNANLGKSLVEWYNRLPEVAKNSVYTTSTSNVIDSIKAIQTADEEEIAGSIAFAATGIFIEDWGKSSAKEFGAELERCIAEVNEKKSINIALAQKVTFASDSGDAKECFYNYNPETMSSAASFFKSSLDDIMDEFGETMETNEKIGILLDMVKQLIG